MLYQFTTQFTFLIGHRGVGKSALLKRIQENSNNVDCFDLDLEIENEEGLKVTDIFHQQGEDYFRKCELKVLNKIINYQKNKINKTCVALGAGFVLESLNPLKESLSVQCIFVSRYTDILGRMFSNRPRLLPELDDPLQEYKIKYKQRQELFLRFSNIIYHIPEGDIGIDHNFIKIESNILCGQFDFENVFYTIKDQNELN